MPRIVLLVLATVLFSGCGPLLTIPGDEPVFYLLEGSETVGTASSPGVLEAGDSTAVRLLVREARGNRLINSHKIVFRNGPSTRGFYKLAQWVEPPPEQLTSMLIAKLRGNPSFSSASRPGGTGIADFQINLEVQEFSHDITSSPGTAAVVLNVEVVDLASREVRAQRQFARDFTVDEYSAAGAVRGFSVASEEILDEIISWLKLLSLSRPQSSAKEVG